MRVVIETDGDSQQIVAAGSAQPPSQPYEEASARFQGTQALNGGTPEQWLLDAVATALTQPSSRAMAKSTDGGQAPKLI